MSTKITLDNPTGDGQEIPDLGIRVENGGSIEVEDHELAARLLQNPIWKGRKPHKTGSDDDKAGEAEGDTK